MQEGSFNDGSGLENAAHAIADAACHPRTNKSAIGLLADAVVENSGNTKAVIALLHALSIHSSAGSSLSVMWCIGRRLVGNSELQEEIICRFRRRVKEGVDSQDIVNITRIQISICNACEEMPQAADDSISADIFLLKAVFDTGDGGIMLGGICSMALLGDCYRTLRVCETMLSESTGALDSSIWKRIFTDHILFAMPGGPRPLPKLMQGCEDLAVRMLPHCVESLFQTCNDQVCFLLFFPYIHS